MTNAGWYPDPAGAPDTFRYWDGQSWSQMTTSQPPAASSPAAPQQPPTQAPPPQAPPTPAPNPAPQPVYGQYGQQQPWSPQPQGGQGGKGGGNGKTIGIAVAAVLALVLLGVGTFLVVSQIKDDDADKRTDDNPSETDTTGGSTDASTDSTIKPSGIQCTGGNPELPGDPLKIPKTPKTVTGGGLTIPRPGGFELSAATSSAHSFADEISVVVKAQSESWIYEHAVGGLAKANGFTSTDQAAEIIMQCLTTNIQIYEGFESRTDLSSEEVTVDGKPAHRITSEIRVNNPKVTVEGDVTTVIVVDTGDADSFGLYIGVGTIDDQPSIDVTERVIGQITVN